MARSTKAPGKPATPGKAFGMGMMGTGRQGKGQGMPKPPGYAKGTAATKERKEAKKGKK